MKFLPIIALSMACATSAFAQDAQMTSVGRSAKAPKEVASCIAKSWADKTQQPVVSQTVIANDLGVDVLLPGQQPGGSAAVVRPAPSGNGSWAGLRTVGGSADPAASSDISACL
ncbi:hypothetical protein [Chitinasiproducens palmae]|uniref:Uncharacterized protein n=1 Tax=Chitinasiproducens palmae TaxID=1770053 RepID=A0A1H2PWX9_9BURK|nr:hypothetical protein [Chitinasiproducens palmae]SDV51474.1 hypothetical protein SAMN05216551_11774 [Chitinasiproducens palmae]